MTAADYGRIDGGGDAIRGRVCDPLLAMMFRRLPATDRVAYVDAYRSAFNLMLAQQRRGEPAANTSRRGGSL